MLQTVPDILARIVAHKHQELSERSAELRQLESQAEAAAIGRRGFRQALASSTPAIISEIKKASPSKGLLSETFDPPSIARMYERGGAAALSVLTDERFFQGSFADLQAARQAVRLPVLRKDFTVDPLHVVEAAARGADAILLIAAILETDEMRRLREQAEAYGLDVLVEVHDDGELNRALESGATIIGVNNRDLRTFQVHLDTSLRLAERMPQGILTVSESGIHSAEDVRLLRAAGYQAFLVGEHLMKSPDPSAALEALRS
ncbi:MAG TPA: indole-3-glycerol phosphate synthase TrpC [Bryobacteraceae bacterium]|nr:indole-3-glycerol phosphate synthase TrpC [Bryobacteraceae bacterium]